MNMAANTSAEIAVVQSQICSLALSRISPRVRIRLSVSI